MKQIGEIVKPITSSNSMKSYQPSTMAEHCRAIIQKYPTYERMMLSFSRNLQPYLLKNVEKAYSDKSPLIGVIDNAYGQGCAALWVKTQLLTIDLIAGLKEPADMAALDKFSQLFVAKYGCSIKLTEFLLFCARFSLGMYGRFYGCFDPIMIGNNFSKFLRERKEELDMKERKRYMAERERMMVVEVERDHQMPDDLRKRLRGGGG